MTPTQRRWLSYIKSGVQVLQAGGTIGAHRTLHPETRQALLDKGWVRWEAGRMVLTEEGRRYVERVA